MAKDERGKERVFGGIPVDPEHSKPVRQSAAQFRDLLDGADRLGVPDETTAGQLRNLATVRLLREVIVDGAEILAAINRAKSAIGPIDLAAVQPKRRVGHPLGPPLDRDSLHHYEDWIAKRVRLAGLGADPDAYTEAKIALLQCAKDHYDRSRDFGIVARAEPDVDRALLDYNKAKRLGGGKLDAKGARQKAFVSIDNLDATRGEDEDGEAYNGHDQEPDWGDGFTEAEREQLEAAIEATGAKFPERGPISAALIEKVRAACGNTRPAEYRRLELEGQRLFSDHHCLVELKRIHPANAPFYQQYVEKPARGRYAVGWIGYISGSIQSGWIQVFEMRSRQPYLVKTIPIPAELKRGRVNIVFDPRSRHSPENPESIRPHCWDPKRERFDDRPLYYQLEYYPPEGLTAWAHPEAKSLPAKQLRSIQHVLRLSSASPRKLIKQSPHVTGGEPEEADLDRASERREEVVLSNEAAGFAPYRGMGFGRLELVATAGADFVGRNLGPRVSVDLEHGHVFKKTLIRQDHTRTVEFGGGVERRVCTRQLTAPKINLGPERRPLPRRCRLEITDDWVKFAWHARVAMNFQTPKSFRKLAHVY